MVRYSRIGTNFLQKLIGVGGDEHGDSNRLVFL
jgi:hypothetical protein